MSHLPSFKDFIKTGVFALLVLAMAGASAETPQESKVKALVKEKLDKMRVDEVRKTPYSGLFEVRTGKKILYTDSEANYIFAGHIFDTASGKDLTKARLAQINKIKFSDLPLDLAVKMVKGNGKRRIAVFSDPNCGYCKRFEKALEGVDNITVYTFMYPILGKNSAVKSRNIWCASDSGKAWHDWMVKGKASPAAPAKCEDPALKVLKLGRKLGISGTPTIFFTDGTRVPGAIDARMLKEKLAKMK